ncbi:MAG: ATP-binding protein [Spirosomataceae bacterium]
MKPIFIFLFLLISFKSSYSQVKCEPLVLNTSSTTIIPNKEANPEKYISYLLQREFYFHIQQHDSAGHYLPEVTKWYAQNGKKELPEWEGVYNYVQGRAMDGTDKIKALAHFQKALEYFRKREDKAGEINALLAISQLNMNNYGERSGSFEYLLANAREAIQLSQEINCIELELRAMSLEASLYMSRENTDMKKYTTLIQKQYQRIKKNKVHPLLRADIYTNLSNVYASQNNFSKAEKYLLLAISLYETLHTRKKQTLAEINLSVLYGQQGNFQKTISISKNILKKTPQSDFSVRRSVFGNMATAYKLLGDFKSAYAYNDSTSVYYQKITEAKNTSSLNELQTKYETEKNKRRSLELEKENVFMNQRLQMYLAMLAIALIATVLLVIQYRQVQKKNEELQDANTEIQALVEARAYLFGIIAHDLRRPLHAFQGINELVSYYLKKKEYHEIEQISNLIDESGQRIQLMLDNLLKWSLSQKTEIPYEPMNLNVSQVVESTLELYKGLERAYEIKIDSFVPSDLVIYADRVGIELILRNLIDNASKVVTAGGRIYITARRRDTEILLEIGDTGTGIPENKRALLENAFAHPEKLDYTNKELGLGIVLISKFTQRNRGKIRFTTEKDKGTLFQLFFPATEE